MIWTTLFIGYLLTWAVIPLILFDKKRPVSALAWIWSVMLFPYFGALAYLLFGIDRIKRKRVREHARQRADQSESAVTLAQFDRTDLLVKQLEERERKLLALLSRLNQIPTSTISDVQLLFDAGSFYPAFEKAIRGAREYIHIEFYVWNDDDYGQRFLDLLIGAARRGVEVRLLADEIGCLRTNAKFFQPLIDAGGKFSWFHSVQFWRNRFAVNLRDHRKLQIIDGEFAFVGGMNIGAEYDGKDGQIGLWRDAQMQMSGDIIGPLQEVFANDWYFATNEKLTDKNFYEPKPNTPRCVAQIVDASPDSLTESMPMSVTSLLNFAAERVWIATGYFVPDSILLSALQICAARGVDVRLIISEKSDHPYLLQIGRSFYEDLLRFGVRIFEYSKGVNHTKAVALDGKWLMVGSANFDNRSMRLSFELNVLINSPEKTAELEQFFREDFASSHEIELEEFRRRPFSRRVSEAVFRPLAPLL